MVDLFGDDGVALVFDGSFEGWLSVVFYAYEHRLIGRHITVVAKHDEILHLFLTTLQVPTDKKKALRVLDKIRQILDLRQVIWAFLSEDATIYTHLLSVVVHQLDHPNKNVMQNYAHPDVLAVHQCIKKVGRERHRMQAFIRFECTDNDVYFAKVNPDFNVLPLIGDFFAKRFADQSWLIFDVVRGYGIFYDHTNPKAGVREVVDIDQRLLDDSSTIHGEKEPIYQRLWQAYSRHVTIKERINTKHHIAQMPRRYWQYLTEKKGF